LVARRAAALAVSLVLVAAVPLAAIPASQPREVPDSAFVPVRLPADRAPMGEVAEGRPDPSLGVVPQAVPTVPRATEDQGPDLDAPRPGANVDRQPRDPAPTVVPVVPAAAPPPPPTTRAVSGTPTWYCKAGRSRCTKGYPDVAGQQFYAAAGPSLRVGSWRGRTVSVTANGITIKVKLIDWCACGGDHFLDLYWDAFDALGRPAKATVSW